MKLNMAARLIAMGSGVGKIESGDLLNMAARLIAMGSKTADKFRQGVSICQSTRQR